MLSTLNTTRPLFASYLRIRSLASSVSSPELVQSRNELQATLEELSSDLQDLVESVKAVEGDPFRYGLDIEEVGRRRKLVEEVGGEVEGMRRELQKAVAVSTTGVNGHALPSPSAFDAVSPDDDDYGAFEQQRQVEMMHEQDEALDGVFKTVGNLRQQANDMGRELEEQGGMLEEVDTLADKVGGKLQNGIKRVGWVIKKNEGTVREYLVQIITQLMLHRYNVKLLYWGAHLRTDSPTDPGHRTLKAGLHLNPTKSQLLARYYALVDRKTATDFSVIVTTAPSTRELRWTVELRLNPLPFIEEFSRKLSC